MALFCWSQKQGRSTIKDDELSNKPHSNYSNNSQDHSKKAKAFNPYSGGRHLNAIRYSDLCAPSRHILHEISGQLDFRKNFQEPIIMSKPQIAKMTGLSSKTVTRHLLVLESEGYVKQASVGRNVSQINLTSKLFDEYRAKMSRDTESVVQIEQGQRVPRPGTESPGCRDRESLLSSPSSPLLYPFNFSASLLDIINHVKQGKATIMPIKDHPLTAVLKQASQKRKEERASKTLVTASIEKTVSIDTPKSYADPESLFKEYQGHFKGGSGRFCYKAQRNFWNLIVENNLVDEAKRTMNFFHGVDKPTAQVSAGNKRMSEDEYVKFLYAESNGVRSRKEKDRKEQEEITRKMKEQEEMIKNRTPEENARRKEKIEKMRKMLKGNHR